MFRTVAEQPTLWESILPDELRRLPAELARWMPCWTIRCSSPRSCRSSTPDRAAVDADGVLPAVAVPEVPLPARVRVVVPGGVGLDHLAPVLPHGIDQPVPHPTTLMKLTTRCGSVAVEGLNEALLAKAAEAKLLRCTRVRVDTTVVPANVAYPTDSGLLDRFGAAGQGGPADRDDGAAYPGRRRCGPHQDSRPFPGRPADGRTT